MRWAALYAMALAACSDPVTPEPPVVTVKATLADLQAKVFTPKCAQGGCHNAKDAATAYDLALDTSQTSWQELVGVKAQGQTGWELVVAGQPEKSFLLWTLQKSADIVPRMPLGGPYLSAQEIDAVRQWIAAGAKPD
jgi:hypothetical protein